MLHPNLQNLGFKKANGLVMLTEKWQQEPFGTFEAIELQHLARAAKLGAAAVFFRREFDENTKNLIKSEPVLYIFEKENFVNSQEHKDLHAKIWSASEIEVYFIVSQTDIHIFNARKPAEITKNDLNLNSLSLASAALSQFNDFRFSTFLFQSGTFWEQETLQKNLDINKSPYAILLSELGKVRTTLQKKYIDINKRQALDKLLLLTILVKFLEDKKDSKGQFALQEKYAEYQVENFETILRKDKKGEFCIKFLQDLANDYNGKIFDILKVSQEDLDKDGFDNEKFIQSTDLQIFADFIKADIDIDTKQLKFWKQYAFDYLPVELLSAIYENFLGTDANKGVVYTPPFLVNFLVDEVMPLSKASEYFATNNFKVLDPACGSGVFLVAAYKRMLQWWFINEYRKTCEIPEKFEPKVCKNILEQNIFGVDTKKTATQITIFSLTIAYLDKLEPKTFWDKIKFQDLTNNITDKDFFIWGNSQSAQNFDLVIGNPPFNEESTNNSSFKVNIEFSAKFTHKEVPNNKFVLQFFEGAMFLGKKVCLIIPSNNLLYTKDAQKYRQAIFTDFTVEKIFDFTHLRETLFVNKNYLNKEDKSKKGRIPVLGVIVNNIPSKGQNIEHTIVKRIICSEKKLKFEIDHYDRHFIRHDLACNENLSFIWKTNLLGGGQLFHLVRRLSELETLGAFIVGKQNDTTNYGLYEVKIFKNQEETEIKEEIETVEDCWVYNTGYVKRPNSKQFPAPYLYNKPTIISKSFTEDGKFITEIETNNEFSDTGSALLFEPPLLIIKCSIGKNNIPIKFMQQSIAFKDRFIGIHAPEKDKSILLSIAENIKVKYNKLYRLYIWVISSEALVNREGNMNKKDVDALPFPENEEYLQLSDSEQILQNDVLDYYIHLGKSINESETGEKLLAPVNETILKDFGKAFCETINPMHAENNMFWQIGEVYKTDYNNFIIYKFIFCELKENNKFEIQTIAFENIEKDLDILIFNSQENSAAVYTRVVRLYDSNENYDSLILIKPIATRYWLQSIALRDVDETILDYYEAGY